MRQRPAGALEGAGRRGRVWWQTRTVPEDDEELDALIGRLEADQSAVQHDPVLDLPRAMDATVDRGGVENLPFAEAGGARCEAAGRRMMTGSGRASSAVVPEMVRCGLVPGHEGAHATSPVRQGWLFRRNRWRISRWET
jgi:hypothetical protein